MAFAGVEVPQETGDLIEPAANGGVDITAASNVEEDESIDIAA
jgi:hypothetical protein